MMSQSITLPINITRAMGAYSVKIHLGSEQVPVHVMLDTGSSTLAVQLQPYDPETDQNLTATPFAQDVVYGSGGWAGPVIKTHVGLDHEDDICLEHAPLAILSNQQQNNFMGTDGIWGLAYHHLNKSYDVSAWLAAQKPPLAKTYPWPFDIENTPGAIADFRKFLKAFPEQDITPSFTAFEEAKVVPNQFTMITHRSVKCVPEDHMSQADMEALEVNQGQWIIGTYFNNRERQTIKVIHDAYYNVVLTSVQVAGFDPCPAPPLDEAHVHNFFSNAIIDSGSSFLVLQKALYAYVLNCFDQIDPQLRQQIDDFNQAREQNQPYRNDAFDLNLWPTLHFTFESTGGQEETLSVPASQYWQQHADGPEQWFCTLLNQLPKWPDQSILGLPLMNGYACTFDRSTGKNGLIHFSSKS